MSTVVMMVPIHVDGYFLGQDRMTAEAFANFENLPFSDGSQDYNPDTSNLSQSILSAPLQDNNLTLGKGMHLHWSLPDALTKGESGGTVNDFYAVPNRWLVKRKSALLGDLQWVVESDYLHTDLENAYNGISYPLDTATSTGQRHGFLGRRFNLVDWQEDSSATRLSRLTAIGYGEPTFAAFYPNCHSVFGCYDPDVDTPAKTVGLSYQVIGWYSNDSQDPIAKLVDDNPGASIDDLEEAIRDKFSWNIALGADDTLQGMVCYADLTLNLSTDFEDNGKSATATVSVGNTGTEALSAFLADAADTENDATARIQMEEQLENLLLQTKLQSNDLDLGARFLEARHEKGFVATRGGSIFEIQPANEDTTATSVDINLPPAMETALSELNLAKQEEDQANYVLDQQRQILFADWSKYMESAYPPDGASNDYPDVDAVRQFIQAQDIPAIQDAILDRSRKQITAASLQTAIQAQVDLFNAGTVTTSLLLRDMTSETVDQTRITLTNVTWPENKPFSNTCAGFNGTDANLTIDLSSNEFTTVKSLSMWVNISTQNADDAALLATQNGGVLMGKNGIADFWDKLIIDGVEQPGGETLSWSSIPKDRWVYLHVEFTTALDDSDVIYLFSNAATQYAIGKLGAIRLFSDSLSEDEIYYDQNMRQNETYELNQVSGANFWQPTEPVLLIEGDAVEPTQRHGVDGRMNENKTLDCDGTSVGNFPLSRNELATVLTAVDSGAPTTEEKIGYATQSQQAWNPFLLEWQVEVLPISEGGNLNIENKQFSADFLTTNFELEENSPELTPQNGSSVISAAATYKGRSILTPYAKTQLLSTILGQLKGLLAANCYQVIGDIPDAEVDTYSTNLDSWFDIQPALTEWFADDADYDTQMADHEAWYLTKPVYAGAQTTFQAAFSSGSPAVFDETAAKLSDFNYALIKAYQQARASHFISQALSGFNNALLMHHQTLQLPVDDPLGFEDYQAFTRQVAEYVADNNNLAALPLNDFLPLRSGNLRLTKLQLIDSFGQTKTLDITNLIKAGNMATPETPVANANTDDIWLSPRIVQPSRLNFRWLAANSGTQELNSHPDSTPICGWLLANNLDSSVDVYDADGFPIGVIDQEARWRGVPGNDIVVNPKNIENEHLRKVVNRLALVYNETDINNAKRDFLQAFISNTDAALENIDPESYVHHKEISLLMGRPIAIVRASLGLELKGNPAIHHGWTEFIQDLNRDTRKTDAFEEVAVPVRIGERGQLNDGILGYWKEDGENELGSTFHTTTDASAVSNADIQTYEDAPLNISLTAGGGSTTLTLLADPRGDLHATTGMLPVQSLFIPKSLYTDALQRINITFLTAPVLTGEDQVALPLPNELGYAWSWLAKDRFDWVEVANTGILRKDTVVKTFGNGDDIWAELLTQGWITQIDDNRANIVSADQRKGATLTSPIDSQTGDIQALLDASHIVPPNLQATFTQKHVLKEGWLKLSPASS